MVQMNQIPQVFPIRCRAYSANLSHAGIFRVPPPGSDAIGRE